MAKKYLQVGANTFHKINYLPKIGFLTNHMTSACLMLAHHYAKNIHLLQRSGGKTSVLYKEVNCISPLSDPLKEG